MERYQRDEWTAQTFDTLQFSDIEVAASLSYFEKSRKAIVFNIGVGGSIITITPPLVHEGRIVFGACDKRVYCIDMDGREVWWFRTDDITLGTPTLAEGVLYAGSYDGNL